MAESADRLAASLSLSVEQDLEREFEARLVESSTLAFRVAFCVLRHREDAEDVAQDSFANASRHFHRLRDRDRFRAWLVRITWRLAMDRLRAYRRRASRDIAYVNSSVCSTAEVVATRDRAAHLWRAIDAFARETARRHHPVWHRRA